MIIKCRHDKVKDIKKTIPGLAMSIEDAMLTGVINATGTEIPYTNETSVAEVGNYLTDAVDIAMAAKNLGQSLSNLPVSQTPSGGENA